METSTVQKFFNTNQYKLMLLLFAAGIFYAKSEFSEQNFELYKLEIVERFKEQDNEIYELKEQVNYNADRVSRQINNKEVEILLKVDVKILELRLEEANKKIDENKRESNKRD